VSCPPSRRRLSPASLPGRRTWDLRYAPPVAEETPSEGLKERLSRQGEEALGRLAEELAANSVVSSAIAGAFEARERAAAAQEAAMGALGIPSAA
jgi:hypothetical protein